MTNQLPDYEKSATSDINGQSFNSNSTDLKSQPAYATQTPEIKNSTISDSAKLKHDRSVQMYPDLNLSEGEYVISAVKRHPIGLFAPISVGILLLTVAFSVLFNFDLVVWAFQLNSDKVGLSLFLIPIILFMLLVIVGTYVFYYIYTNNRFFLTNECVIQEIQTGLFTKLEQTVSLSNIEDASFTKIGIAQQIFDYGSIRLSTEGDETTYRFSYVANPKAQIATLNNAIEAFKNGRPIDEN